MITINENSVRISDEGVDITLAKNDYIVIKDGSAVAQVMSATSGKITTVDNNDADALIAAFA